MSTEESYADREAFRRRDAGDVEPSPLPEVRLPQHGELHNASSIPVSDMALAALLCQARIAEVLLNCQVEDCENCNAHRMIWWDCCNALDRATRISLQTWLIAEGYGLPDAPWEDVVTDGTPSQRNHIGPRA